MAETEGIQIGKHTDDGVQRVSIEPSEAPSETIFITPNMCDPTTWYQDSVQVVDEVASHDDPPNDYTQYSVANTNLIDTYHGKLPGEDTLDDGVGGNYRVIVKVNDVTKTEDDPHLAAGNGDYTVDYAAGTITFNTALTAPDVVKATYHYENGSSFSITPLAGKMLKLVKAEIQLSEDIILEDTILIQVCVGGTPVKETRYKSMADLYSEAQGTYPSLPALGGSGWRGMTQPVHTLPFVYLAVSILRSSQALSMKVSLENGKAFGGSFATATFYCLSEDE